MRNFLPLLCLSTLGAALCSPPAWTQEENAAADATPLAERLQRLGERIEDKREELHIPGCALVVVKDGEVIFSRGFGRRDVEKDLPVTDETLFAIGSSTKAFTATLAAMFVDEGTMAWDDPIRKHLPEFELHDPEAQEGATMADLLCHRVGLDRTDLAWASGTASVAEVLAAAGRAEPVAKFRKEWHYQNAMFLVVGEAIAHAAQSDFSTLIKTRLLQPLNMDRSNLSIRECHGDLNLSTGYRWDEDDKSFHILPMRSLGTIAPAGAINSCARDMAQWLRLQLGRGEIDGKRLVSEAAITETWIKHSTAAPGMDYGLGWFLRDWRGHKLVEHGGNIDGFGAQVALLPDQNIGFALLSNVTATPLQAMSIDIVFDSLLGELNAESPSLELATISKYLGKYHFDAMKLDMTVLHRGGKLAVDVPGQMIFDLKPPDADGKWAFDFPTPIQVAFVTNEDDEVTLMRLYQGGLEFELPREGVPQPIDISLDDAKPYLGVYHSVDMKSDLTVKHKAGRLAVDVPGQMVYELHLPDAEGKWAFRAKRDIVVSFNRAEDGTVSSMTMLQDGRTFPMPRVRDDASTAELPSLEELIAKTEAALGSVNARKLTSLRLNGPVDFVNQGITGTNTITTGSIRQFKQDIDLDVYGFIRMAIDGATGAVHSSFQPFEVMKPKMINEHQFQHPLLMFADWKSLASSVTLHGSEQLDGETVYLVRLSNDKDGTTTFFIDAETGLPRRQTFPTTVEGLGIIESTLTFEDWREVGEFQYPFKQTMKTDIQGRVVMIVEEAEMNVELPPDAFTIRDPGDDVHP